MHASTDQWNVMHFVPLIRRKAKQKCRQHDEDGKRVNPESPAYVKVQCVWIPFKGPHEYKTCVNEENIDSEQTDIVRFPAFIDQGVVSHDKTHSDGSQHV